MLQAIEGIYRNGTIQLAEMPQGVSESRVIVTFLELSPRLLLKSCNWGCLPEQINPLKMIFYDPPII
jgi:hypothetical protein